METIKQLLTLIIVLVIAPHDRYRRAGIGFVKGENKVEVTEDQLALLEADARLKVTVLDERSVADGDSAPPKTSAREPKTAKQSTETPGTQSEEPKGEGAEPSSDSMSDAADGASNSDAGSLDDDLLDLTNTPEELGLWVAAIHTQVKAGTLKKTGSGTPDIKALEKALDDNDGIKLTGEIRDAAWQEYLRLTDIKDAG